MKMIKVIVDSCIALIIIAAVLIICGAWFGFDAMFKVLSYLGIPIFITSLFLLTKILFKLADYIHNRMLNQNPEGFIEIKKFSVK